MQGRKPNLVQIQIPATVMLRIVGWAHSLVGSGRRSIVPETNGSQHVGGCNPVLTCSPKTEAKVTAIFRPKTEPKLRRSSQENNQFQSKYKQK